MGSGGKLCRTDTPTHGMCPPKALLVHVAFRHEIGLVSLLL